MCLISKHCVKGSKRYILWAIKAREGGLLKCSNNHDGPCQLGWPLGQNSSYFSEDAHILLYTEMLTRIF